MATASGSKVAGALPQRSRRPRAGERNRGAVDAVQTKIAVNLQHLDPDTFEKQLSDNIGELPDATGCDAAFVALFSDDGAKIETVLTSGTMFSGCNPEVLTGELLENWPWLSKRLSNLRLIEIDDTDRITGKCLQRLIALDDFAGLFQWNDNAKHAAVNQLGSFGSFVRRHA